MGVKAIRLAEIADLSEAEQDQRIKSLSDQRLEVLNGQAEDLDRQISAFETRYEMSSATMLKRFHAQKICETAEIGTWMMLLTLRDRIGKPAS